MSVIYVAGSMRSGTTLMAELLGSYPGALAVGEVNNLWFVAPTGQRCSCGELGEECPVWGPVLDHFGGTARAPGYHALRKSLERQRHIPRYLALARRRESDWPADVATYVSMLREVLDLISKTTGATTLVDSSKTAASLALMSLAVPDRLSVLHLLREPRGVAFSEQRNVHAADELTSRPPMVRSTLKSARDWDTGNLECWVAGRAAATYHRVWYDRLCAAPEATMAAVGKAMGFGDASLPFTGSDVVLSSGHVLSGNPSRVGPRTRHIAPDERWKEGLGRPDSVAVGALTWPVRRVLGG